MINTQAQKVVQVIAPAAIVDNASFTVVDVDTLGFDRCSVYFMLGATDIAMTALKLQESDDDSTYADISGGGHTAPSATADNGIYAWHVACGGPRKRYLRVVATAGDGAAGTYAAAWATLDRAKEMPSSATERGLNAELFL